jgi:hypothetical protein
MEEEKKEIDGNVGLHEIEIDDDEPCYN